MTDHIDKTIKVVYTQGELALQAVADEDDTPEDTTNDPVLDWWLGNQPDQAEEAMTNYFYD